MNEHLISKVSEIEGKHKTYLPSNVVYRGDNINQEFSNVIIVSCYLTDEGLRRYNRVSFHKLVSVEDINKTGIAHFSYVIPCLEENSNTIILDIRGSEYFKQ